MNKQAWLAGGCEDESNNFGALVHLRSWIGVVSHLSCDDLSLALVGRAVEPFEPSALGGDWDAPAHATACGWTTVWHGYWLDSGFGLSLVGRKNLH